MRVLLFWPCSSHVHGIQCCIQKLPGARKAAVLLAHIAVHELPCAHAAPEVCYCAVVIIVDALKCVTTYALVLSFTCLLSVVQTALPIYLTVLFPNLIC